MRQRFIQSFSTSGTEQTAIDENMLGKPYVAYIEDGRYIDWNTKGIDYANTPLTFEIISGGTIVFNGYASWLENRVISASRDNGETWETLTPTAAGTSINVSPGEKLIFKGYNANYGLSNAFCKFANSTAHFNIYGNIMSLVDYDNFPTLKTFSAEYVFPAMFRDCNAHNVDIYLPASVLTDGCYYNLFAEYGTHTIEKIKITCLATDITAEDCTDRWLENISPTGTFVKHPNATWPSGASGVPAGWTVIDADI